MLIQVVYVFLTREKVFEKISLMTADLQLELTFMVSRLVDYVINLVFGEFQIV